MNTFSRGIRNAFRNSIRTVSIVFILGLSIGLALTMLLAKQAVETKIDSVKSSIGNTITIAPAGARGFQGGGEPLTADQATKIASTSHVVSVIETLQDRLSTDNSNLVSSIEAGSLGRRNGGGTNATTEPIQGRSNTATPPRDFTPPVFVTGVNTLDGAILNGGGKVELTSGEKFDPNADATVALVGKDLAIKNNLTVGSTFTAYSASVTVKGIFDAGNTFSNNAVVMPLVTLQRLSDQTGQVSSIIAQVDSITNLAPTTAALKDTLGSAADVTDTQDTSAQALEPLQNITTITTYSVFGSIIAGAVIILLSMMMIVRERRREIGVLKAIGSGNGRIALQFVVEAVTFTILASVIGLALGIYAAQPVTKALVTNSTASSQQQQQPPGPGGQGGFGRRALQVIGGGGQNLQNIQTSVGWKVLLEGLGAALFIAIIGSAVPAWFISKVRPAEVMRAE